MAQALGHLQKLTTQFSAHLNTLHVFYFFKIENSCNLYIKYSNSQIKSMNLPHVFKTTLYFLKFEVVEIFLMPWVFSNSF